MASRYSSRLGTGRRLSYAQGLLCPGREFDPGAIKSRRHKHIPMPGLFIKRLLPDQVIPPVIEEPVQVCLPEISPLLGHRAIWDAKGGHPAIQCPQRYFEILGRLFGREIWRILVRSHIIVFPNFSSLS